MRRERGPYRYRGLQVPDGASADDSPAGYVTIAGRFFSAHRDEVLACVRHFEQQEKTTHPLERVMAIKAAGDGAQVTTTSVHLARRLGHALKSAFKGDLSLYYNRQDNLLRVRWSRLTD
jgi:hypothetical protein